MQALVGSQQPDLVAAGEHREGRIEVEMPVGAGHAEHLSAEVGAEDGLHRFGNQGAEEYLVAVPYDAGDVVVEAGVELVWLACGEAAVKAGLAEHQALPVGLIAVALHGYPCEVLSVLAPHGVGVVAAARGHRRRGPALAVIDIDAAVGAEGVLDAAELLAGICDVAAVGRPAELLDSAVGLKGQLVEVAGAEYVHGVVGSYPGAAERGHVAARHLGSPVVPMPVHQLLGGVGLRLVERRVAVGGGLQRGVLDAADVDHAGLVGRNRESADSGRYVAQSLHPAELAVGIGSLAELAVVDEIDLRAVGRPAGVADALAETGELAPVAAVGVADEEVGAAAVLRY